jgi:rod shape-determining protein MreC
MLKRLYDFLFTFKDYVVYAVCLCVATALLAANDSSQIRSIRSVVVLSVGLLQDALSAIPNYFDLRRENQVLRELNLNLADEVSRLREARLENLRLHQMLGLRERGEYRYVAAKIIGKNLQLMRNTITLNVGESDGIGPNMSVMTGDGLVGKIVGCSGHYAVAQILYNRDLRVSAKVQRSRVDGIACWEGGSRLLLKDVSKNLDVQPGDVVITSEYSTVFPPGIRIGIVSSAKPIAGSLFQRIEIVPGVDFERVEEVFVVLSKPDSSRVALEKRFGE